MHSFGILLNFGSLGKQNDDDDFDYLYILWNDIHSFNPVPVLNYILLF